MTDLLTDEAERILSGMRLARPPARRDSAGRWARSDHGEWDWFYALPAADQRWIRQRYMSAQGVEPEVVADWWGQSVDECMTAFTMAALGGRARSRDPLDDWEPEEPEHPDASLYRDAMAGMSLDLVGPSEVAERAGVTRSAVTQWRRRYADFPAPLAVIGSARQGPRGGASAGTPVWAWPTVEAWILASGRRVTR